MPSCLVRDIWLTIVWVAYLLVFKTLCKRGEAHLCRNWFYLAFIVTIDAHIVNNLAIPVSLAGWFCQRSPGVAGCADAVLVRPQRGGLLPAGFLGIVLLHPQAGWAAVYSTVFRSFISGLLFFSTSGPAPTICITALPQWAKL